MTRSKKSENVLEYYEQSNGGRGQLVGLVVMDREGRIGMVADSRWAPNDVLELRIYPPWAPAPETRLKDGSRPTLGVFDAGDLDDAVEINGEQCWRSSAADCVFPQQEITSYVGILQSTSRGASDENPSRGESIQAESRLICDALSALNRKLVDYRAERDTVSRRIQSLRPADAVKR